jgi:hypothetical protein
MGLLTQWRWRVAGGLCLAGAGLMAWRGAEIEVIRTSGWLFLAYWGVFTTLFMVTLVCALLDLRYIRMQHAMAEREVFRQTLGDEAFRRALRAAQDAAKRGDTGRKRC